MWSWSGILLREALLAGDLKMRYCSVTFSLKSPTWCLPVGEHVAGLLTAGGSGAGLLDVQLFCR